MIAKERKKEQQSQTTQYVLHHHIMPIPHPIFEIKNKVDPVRSPINRGYFGTLTF